MNIHVLTGTCPLQLEDEVETFPVSRYRDDCQKSKVVDVKSSGCYVRAARWLRGARADARALLLTTLGAKCLHYF